jgi:hypothetical protein
MDTSQQARVTPVAAQRQRRSIAEKRRIVEETLAPGHRWREWREPMV